MSAGEPVDRPDTEKGGAGGSGHSPGAGAPRIEGTNAAITVNGGWAIKASSVPQRRALPSRPPSMEDYISFYSLRVRILPEFHLGPLTRRTNSTLGS
jgi:hypothetical protein